VDMGRETCSEVYRNPDGSPKTNDEYLRTGLHTLLRFSMKPLEKE